MTQYVINIGAIPNDGTGDPLRTAFNETNLNFNQVFAAGPVLSNVRIANNSILTTNTNGNLVLAPNGTGVVQSNVSIVPNLANLRSLGSTTRRWATVYTQYLNVSSGTSINGDLSVAGNLTVQGNIIQVGNIVTDTLTIQLANAASTANAANGAGITVGANDNIATVLYNSTSNVWTTNIGLSSVGNISAPYLFGNGSQLTGLPVQYGNANVVTLLAGFGSNTIATTGNVNAGNVLTSAQVIASGVVQTGTGFSTGGYLSVNGSTDLHNTTVTGNLSATGNITASTVTTPELIVNTIRFDGGIGPNVLPNITVVDDTVFESNVDVDGTLFVLGNVSADYFIGDGSLLTGLPATYGNANVATYLAGSAGNIIPVGNNAQSLGNATNQWNDLYVSNTTIFMNNVPISLGAGNVLTVGGNAVLQNNSNSTISTTGNITADYFIGDGSQLSNVASTGDITFVNTTMSAPDGDDIIVQALDDDGIVSSSLLLDPNNTLTRLEQWSSQDSNSWTTADWTTGVYTNEGGLGVVVFTGATTIIDFINSLGDVGHIFFSVNSGPQLVWDGTSSGGTQIKFYTPTLPATDPTTVTTFEYFYSYSSGFEIDYDSNEVNIYANDADISLQTTNQRAIDLNSSGDVAITANAGGNAAANWTFGTNGSLTLPIGGNLIVSGAIVGSGASPAPRLSGFSSVSAQTLSASGNVTGGNLISSATIYGNVDVVLGNIANASATRTRMVTDTTFSYIQTGNGTIGSTGNIVFSPYSSPTQQVVIDTGSGNLSAAGNVTAQNFIGNISITGNVIGTQPNVTLVAGAYDWTFDNTGNLTLPGNTFAVNYANNTPVDVVTRFEGTWTVPTGNSTQSFTVTPNNTYQMWVEGNIPNGIIAWNATATITNTNVPVAGAQYAWVYSGGGTPIDFTSIPNQFEGTANTIVRSNVAPSTTTNRFDFGINNTSGTAQTVRYGWIQIS